MSDAVDIIDVSPRDGLQNEEVLLATEDKVELIVRLADAGVRAIETTSFVNPRRVPAMADAEGVMAALPHRPDVSYIGLALNERGLERAIAAGCDEVNSVIVASDGFGQANQGMSPEESVAVWTRIATRAHEAGLVPSVVMSVAFGCPFDGEVPVGRVAELAAAAAAARPARLALADTIGVATPADVHARVAAVRAAVGTEVRLGMHFHNTRNTGIANAYAALEEGVRVFDASVGGVGGCPFAPEATGNIPTEDLVYMLHRMGFDTGIDLDRLAETARWLESRLGHPIPGLYCKAGPFPRPRSD